MCCSEISIAFFQTTSSTRFSHYSFSRFLSSPLRLVRCPSAPPASCVSCTLYPCCNSPTPFFTRGRSDDSYNRSLPRCARDFHIKESYLLMRRNYPTHSARRQEGWLPAGYSRLFGYRIELQGGARDFEVWSRTGDDNIVIEKLAATR